MRKTVFEKSSNGRNYDAKCPNGLDNGKALRMAVAQASSV